MINRVSLQYNVGNWWGGGTMYRGGGAGGEYEGGHCVWGDIWGYTLCMGGYGGTEIKGDSREFSLIFRISIT